jgi:hypothetical protein
MSLESLEEGTPCDYCGTPIEFQEDDFAVCPVCQNEFVNMDYYGESPGMADDVFPIDGGSHRQPADDE